ncbi:hypothetical protein [Mucilaginibacter sp. L3T2-6]|uniref:hypothetical protein n=1 Tax=Mucilaginibacter sp. L3T2-6 TaxID=3062491 RepID=UPI0026746DC4|nr:hypothetical protein [Mucilaginibacter sp. L3T2-6]MDO3641761.1 hypothetical protein [Mucilaginibacter sp. L3T2-6]MDV6214255.1 hypothetical protein [Mucilaginibacter sp. L3T2-6]
MNIDKTLTGAPAWFERERKDCEDHLAHYWQNNQAGNQSAGWLAFDDAFTYDGSVWLANFGNWQEKRI